MKQISRSLLSSRATIGAACALASALFVSARGTPTDAASDSSDVMQEAEIQKLTVCFARGTDAIGVGDVAGGKNIYKTCFANDADFSVYFPGADADGPPDMVISGSDSWGDFVGGLFQASGYVATQHLMGSVDVHITGNNAIMTTYAHDTHVLPDGTIDVATGTYEDQVVRRQGRWWIKHRTAKVINLVHLGAPQP